MPFETGDVVVCINAEINPDCQPNPPMVERLKKGALYRVARYFPVCIGRTYWGGKPMAGLQLVGVDHSPGHGWQAWRFRKLAPADHKFIERLQVRKLEPAEGSRDTSHAPGGVAARTTSTDKGAP